MSLHTRTVFGRQFSESDASGDATRDIDSSSGTSSQGGNQPSVRPVGSAAARFQIRSAKTLQYGPARHIYEDKTNPRYHDSNKSKSLDSRGAGTRTGHRNTTGVSSGTRDYGQNVNKNEPNHKITSNTDNQPNSVPWRYQGSSVTGQGDRKDYLISESRPGTMNHITPAMDKTGDGLSLPIRLKSRLSQRSIEEDSNLWTQQHDEPNSDLADNRKTFRVREQGLTNTEEVTGNQTILERIEKLFGANSPSGPLSPSESHQKRPLSTSEKAGTFPRRFSKNEQTFFDKIQEPPTPEITHDQRDSSYGDFFSNPKSSMEKPAQKKFQSFTSADNLESRRMISSDYRSRPLVRSRSNLSETVSSSGQRAHVQSIGFESNSNIANQSVKHLVSPIKKETETESTKPKYPQESRGVANSETHQEDEEKSDSVKSTIHKFEALAQQSQSAPQTLRARRALSVPDQPKPVVHVKKSESDLNLTFRRVVGNTENVGMNPIDARKGSEGNLDLNKTLQSNSTIQVKPTSKAFGSKTYTTSIDIVPTFNHDPKPDQHNTRDENKMTVHNILMDEPDIAIVPRSGLPNPGPIEKKSKIPTVQSTVSQQTNVNRLVKQQSIRVNMDYDKDDEDDDTPTNSPNRDPLTINMQRETNTVRPKTSVRTSDSVFTPVKSAANGTSSKAVSDPASHGPGQTHHFYLNNSNNNNYITTMSDPYGVSMARWSSDEEDYVYDDYEDSDSDSGESSVTITSNMSQSDRRSFSLSLAELSIYSGVDLKPSALSQDGEDWVPSRSASLSSDISAFSSVTLLSNHELDRLIDEVKNLGDDTLQKYADVLVVVLHKEVGCGLGFTLAGGVDQNKPVTVHRVIPGGVAAQEGSVFEGDWVLSINGTPLQECAHWEALRTLRKSRSQNMAVVVLQRGDQNETQHRKEAIHRPQTGKTIYVTLNKSSYDLGFSLEGGVDSSLGDRPLTVQKIFQGGPGNKVFPGDELLEVQGHSLTGMRRIEAVNLIRRLPPGPVEVLLHRPHQPY